MDPAIYAKRIHYFKRVEPGNSRTIGFACELAKLFAFGSGLKGCNLNLEGVQLHLLDSLLETFISQLLIHILGLL